MSKNTEEKTSERKAIVIPVPSPSGAVKATGRGLHTAGRVVADANLRSAGRAVKSLGRRLPRPTLKGKDDTES